jgi:hypothetical protein
MTTGTKPRRARYDPPPWVGKWPRLDGPQEPKYYSAHPDRGTADRRDAVRAARFTKRVTRSRCFPWQWNVLLDSMLRNPEGLWLHRVICLVCTRQQGKTWIMVARILFGLFYLGETIVYSAQRGQTADAVFERVLNIIKARPDLFANLIEHTGGKQGRGDIRVRSKNGQIAHLRCGVRSTDLGRGLDEIDLVVFDEAYNLTPAEVAALTGAQIASPNAQTIYTSTAPVASIHAFCLIFGGMREAGVKGCRVPELADPETLFYEFAAPDPPPDERERALARVDRENWRLASPSHGVISKDRDIDANRAVLCVNAEGTALWEADYLGWGEWPVTAENREPVIPLEEVWLKLINHRPELTGQRALAIARSTDLARWYIACGQRTMQGRVGLEVGYAAKAHIGQFAHALLAVIEALDPAAVVVEGHDPGVDIVPAMARLGIEIHKTNLPEWSIASAGFIDAAFAGDLEHGDQPIIRECLETASMRELPRGDRVFDDRDSPIAPLKAYVLAHWATLTFAEEFVKTALPRGTDIAVGSESTTTYGHYDDYGLTF